MHKSKLAGFIIYCQTGDLAAAADFWSQALGMEQQALPGDEGDKYVRLVDPHDTLHVEVRRLEALGAKRVEQVHAWWVMEAPTGQRFCVVRKSSTNFDGRARRWL